MSEEKMEVDFSSETANAIEKCKTLIQNGKRAEAIEELLVLECQARSAADAISTGKILSFLVEVYSEAGAWEDLNAFLLMSTKKRGQLKHAVTVMVQKACEYVESTPDKETKIKLINVLRIVSEGKIYVEIERARLTKKLVDIKEADGEIAEAANIFQELQVETLGSMEKREKTEFILEQMRLCLAKKDYIRTQIISHKIGVKYFDEANTEDLKRKYYNLMIQLNLYNSKYLDVSKNFLELYYCSTIQENEENRLSALASSTTYLLLAPYDHEKNDITQRYKRMRDMEKLTEFAGMLNHFTTMELIQWKLFSEKYESHIYTVFRSTDPESSHETLKQRWEDLHKRCMEHSVRVMAAFYTRLSLNRMAQLLDMDVDASETLLSTLVVNKTIHARIDRLNGEVHFTESKTAVEVLNDWSNNLNELMNLLNKTNHLIKKERMVFPSVS